MTLDLASIFGLLQPSRKADARCRRLPKTIAPAPRARAAPISASRVENDADTGRLYQPNLRTGFDPSRYQIGG